MGISGNFTLFQPQGGSGGSVTPTFTYRSVTTTDSCTISDFTLGLSSSSFTETIYTAVGNSGRILVLEHLGLSFTQVYTLATTSGQTIAGYASGAIKLYTNGESITLQSDGTNWQIISHNTVTPWVTYTPSFGTGFGTVTGISAFYRRIGDSLEIMLNATCGTVAANPYSISLPGSISIDTTKISATTNTLNSGTGALIGVYAGNTGSGTGYVVTAAGTSTSLVYLGSNAATSTKSLIASNTSTVFGSSTPFSCRFTVPIAEFTA